MSHSTGLASIIHTPDSSRQFATVRARDLKHPPNWVRSDLGTAEELSALARSYLGKPVNYVLIRPDGTVIDGNRRLAAILAESGPDTELAVCITEEEITPVSSLEIMLETAEHTKSLTPYEKYLGYSEWLKLSGSTATALAGRAHLSDATISKTLALSKGGPELIAAARAGQVGPNEWAMIVQARDQAPIVRDYLSGKIKGRDGLAKAIKAQGEPPEDGKPAPATDTVKLDKLPIAMSEGLVTSTAKKGKEPLSLVGHRLLLAQALAKVDAAIKAGYSLRTASRAWLDTKDRPRKPRQQRKPRETA